MKCNRIVVMFVALWVGFVSNVQAQNSININELAGQMNVISPAVPFLMIAPDSRAGAMGEVGVATSPDINSQHWNPAKYAFIESDMGVAICYTPWLSTLVDDIDLGYVAGYKRLNKQSAVGASLRYFSLGNIEFTNNYGEPIRDYRPSEFAVDISYSLLLSKNLSGGIALRYVNSNLTGGVDVDNSGSHAGRTVAADLAAYYNREIKVSDREAQLAFGMNISNIGGKISYTEESRQDFIPINMKLGSALDIQLDDYNRVAFALDFNKLLIPSPQARVVGGAVDGGDTLIGRDPTNISVASGLFGSFTDAPGGFKEEIHEIAYSVGAEYWYNNQFAVRGGYFHEHETKGNRKFFTVGVGLKLNVFALDFAYLIPTAGKQNPLANTVRFSLLFDLAAFSAQSGN